MKFETFEASVWRQQRQCRSFQPTLVDHAWTWEDSTIITLLDRATRALGGVNAISLIVPDIDPFIQTHVVKQAMTGGERHGIYSFEPYLALCLR